MAGNLLRRGNIFLSYLVALAKLQKATINLIMSVRLSTRSSFRVKQLGAHWTDFHEFYYLNISRKYVEKIQTLFISDVNNGCFT
jgi:hypothetical protein